MTTFTITLDLLHIYLLVANLVLCVVCVWKFIAERRARRGMQFLDAQFINMHHHIHAQERVIQELREQIADSDDEGEEWKNPGRN